MNTQTDMLGILRRTSLKLLWGTLHHRYVPKSWAFQYPNFILIFMSNEFFIALDFHYWLVSILYGRVYFLVTGTRGRRPNQIGGKFHAGMANTVFRLIYRPCSIGDVFLFYNNNNSFFVGSTIIKGLINLRKSKY